MAKTNKIDTVDLKGLAEFKADFLSKWESEHQHIGKIIRCHMLIEHYLREYIRAANPSIGNLEKADLKFGQIRALAMGPKSTLKNLNKGIQVINNIRNRFAHDLEHQISEKEIRPIKRFFQSREEEYKHNDDIELVEGFTKVACGFIAGTINKLKNPSHGLGLRIP